MRIDFSILSKSGGVVAVSTITGVLMNLLQLFEAWKYKPNINQGHGNWSTICIPKVFPLKQEMSLI